MATTARRWLRAPFRRPRYALRNGPRTVRGASPACSISSTVTLILEERWPAGRRRKMAARAGLITRATNRDDDRVMITVLGK